MSAAVVEIKSGFVDLLSPGLRKHTDNIVADLLLLQCIPGERFLKQSSSPAMEACAAHGIQCDEYETRSRSSHVSHHVRKGYKTTSRIQPQPRVVS